MKIQIRFLLVAAAVALGAGGLSVAVLITATAITTAQANAQWGDQLHELRLLENYVDFNYGGDYPVQTLDAEAAVLGGISKETVALAAEMVAYQNGFISHAFHDGKASAPDYPKPMPSDYEKLDAFFQKATKNAKVRNGVLENPVSRFQFGPFNFGPFNRVALAVRPRNNPNHPCGDWGNPLPHYSPVRLTINDPRRGSDYFIAEGFHLTASYATDDDGRDYTYDRSYIGHDGARCASPLFRDHGLVASGNAYSYAVQAGEPNPETLRLSILAILPYWYWPTYVRWWHINDHTFPDPPTQPY